RSMGAKQGAGWFWYWQGDWEKGLYKLGCDRERLKMIKGMFGLAGFGIGGRLGKGFIQVGL
ncbi:hypothetical protein Tco_0279126, partial [Tanacetum coccineum]